METYKVGNKDRLAAIRSPSAHEDVDFEMSLDVEEQVKNKDCYHYRMSLPLTEGSAGCTFPKAEEGMHHHGY